MAAATTAAAVTSASSSSSVAASAPLLLQQQRCIAAAAALAWRQPQQQQTQQQCQQQQQQLYIHLQQQRTWASAAGDNGAAASPSSSSTSTSSEPAVAASQAPPVASSSAADTPQPHYTPRAAPAPAFSSGARLVQPLRRGAGVAAQEGVVHINCSLNNIFVVLTDLNGQVKTYVSGGSVGFKNAGKSTPLAAERAAQELARRALEKGFLTVSVRMRGMGRNKQVALQALAAAGVQVTRLSEVTPTPYNGCRLPRKRRV